MPISSFISSDGQPFVALTSSTGRIDVPVTFATGNAEDPKAFHRIIESAAFSSWITSYIPRPQQRLQVEKITVLSVDFLEHEVKSIRISVSVTRRPENTRLVPTTLTLQGSSVAVLVVFRVNPSGFTTMNTAQYQPKQLGASQQPLPQASQPLHSVPPPAQPSAMTTTTTTRAAVPSNTAADVAATTTAHSEASNNSNQAPRPREYILLCKLARPSIGAPEHREVLSGQINSRGFFVGIAATQLEAITGLRIHEEQTDDLTSIALTASRGGASNSRGPSRSLGVATSPSSLDERVRLLLYRQTVSKEFVDGLLASRRGQSGEVGFEVCPLKDAFCATTDARTLSALFLFLELRYHLLMPKYRHPRETGSRVFPRPLGSGREPTVTRKAPAQFVAVAELNPNNAGANLRVRVARPLEVNETNKQGVVVVGDHTGVVRLRLLSDQILTAPVAFQKAGAPVVLRNIHFDMQDGHLTLALGRFSKAADPESSSDEPTTDTKEFAFTVNTAYDVSAAEYEKVTN